MHRPDLLHQIPPLAYEGGDLFAFLGSALGNIQQDTDLGIHQSDIGLELHSGLIHPLVHGQGLTGLHDAGVGFRGGHGDRLP